MSYKRMIKKSFSQVVPETDNESFMKSVMERERVMEYRKKKHTKKPRVIIAIAAAVMLSVTAVATTINFNDIFGNKYYKAENAETANELIANVTNVETYCDNEDYTVNLKGVTGSEDSFVAVIEIARKDGQPVREYWQNCVLFRAEDPTDSGYIANSRYRTNTREDGALEMIIDCSAFDFMTAKTFYEDARLYENNDDKELISLSDKKIELSGDNKFLVYTGEERQAYRGEATDLEWSVRFSYEPSEPTKNLICEGSDEKVILYRNVDFFDNKGAMKVNYVRAGSSMLIMEYNFNDNVIYDLSIFYGYSENTFTLIKKDGTEIQLSLKGVTDNHAAMFSYIEEKDTDVDMVIDLNEIESLRINDKIYKLS